MKSGIKSLTAPTGAGNSTTGKVVELMSSGGYTYLKIETDQGEKWAAVRQARVSKGQKVTVVNSMVMRNFKSKTLNRTFDASLFGQLASQAGGGSHGGKQPGGLTNAPTLLPQRAPDYNPNF